jgi:protein-S-isoprenylcysteine O-methyltransferase Ste14
LKATEFEYRYRSWILLGIFLAGYVCYNVDHINVVAALVPWDSTIPNSDWAAKAVYFVATLLAGIGAAFLTWTAAYRLPPEIRERAEEEELSVSGPGRYVRNPYYLGWLLILAGLSTFQSRLGFALVLLAEFTFLMRLIGRDEKRLERKYKDSFLQYQQRVPKLLPALRSKIPTNDRSPLWAQALWNQLFAWSLVITLIAFACTLSDPVGYAFAFGTLIVTAISQSLRFAKRRAKAEEV